MLTKSEAILKLNELGEKRSPFSFYSDFLGEKWCIEESSLPTAKRTFQLKIGEKSTVGIRDSIFEKYPIDFNSFKSAFEQVVQQINIGNSFLTNLTFETPIRTNLTLNEIFDRSSAKYKLFVPDQFVVFSPETFVRVANDYIFSYPMKGTIDANVPNAERQILSNRKEKAEHITIVDLIRNDLSQVAQNVEVSKFRFVDKLETNEKNLLQVSSEIRGKLSSNWRKEIGSILSKLLPAGSISGAPKAKTVQIIQEAETYNRAFYTGICGDFDGETLDTGVMIRFIKNEEGRLTFCSGGGITSFSQIETEYQEMVDKVYLPL
ncbi:MAG: aminodeoxychorismate synthase component I [Ekhidna sp.]|nr:aminodeoxychorismate synthase component I [Ekhidna sp.]